MVLLFTLWLSPGMVFVVGVSHRLLAKTRQLSDIWNGSMFVLFVKGHFFLNILIE